MLKLKKIKMYSSLVTFRPLDMDLPQYLLGLSLVFDTSVVQLVPGYHWSSFLWPAYAPFGCFRSPLCYTCCSFIGVFIYPKRYIINKNINKNSYTKKLYSFALYLPLYNRNVSPSTLFWPPAYKNTRSNTNKH